MKLGGIFALFLSTTVIGSLAGSVGRNDFVRHSVLRVRASTEDQFKFLIQLQNTKYELDFWTEPKIGAPTDIMVEESNLSELLTGLNSNSIPNEVMIDDVEDIIQEQKMTRMMYNTVPKPQAIDWNEYYDLPDIESWLESLQANNPDTTRLIQIGTSGEGRNLTVVKITNGDGGTQKPAIFITATIHAREWISTATTTYMINQLSANGSAYADILKGVDFYFLPVINPDGYAFSHSNNRNWRKTRSNHGSALGCIGVDANRNFGFLWGGADVAGSSGDKCSDTYRGPVAFSEPETAAISNFVRDNEADINWTVYITIHSYGQYFLCPWGYTMTLPPNYPAVKNLSDVAAAALTAKYGTQYQTGSSANVLYYTDGTDQDWAYGSGLFQYSYTMELRDTGRYGFLLPANQIIPTADETWAAIQVVARNFV